MVSCISYREALRIWGELDNFQIYVFIEHYFVSPVRVCETLTP